VGGVWLYGQHKYYQGRISKEQEFAAASQNDNDEQTKTEN
jgi:hypothetical protein